MNNEELKKKIKEILRKRMTELLGSCQTDEITLDEKSAAAVIFYADEFADALIAAGYGDVKSLEISDASKEQSSINYYCEMREWKDKCRAAEHRAEVAERALRNAATRLKCRGGLGKGFCRIDKCNYYHCNNDNGCIKAHLEQAEKELAEERKDEN